MMRYIIIFLSLLLVNCSSIKNHYLQFGAYSTLLKSEDNKTKIFFDRYGKMYPEFDIDNQKLKDNYSSLELYYENNIDLLKRDVKKLNIDITEPITKKNNSKYFQLLQIKTFENVINRINNLDFDEITFLIHGYRNRFAYASTSYSNAEQTISKSNKANNHFVEVYWDGLTYTKYNGIKVWDNGQAHSYLVGLELRKVLSNIEVNTIRILGHSTAANLICSSLFNQTSKMSKKDKKEFKSLYIDKLSLPEYKTPDSKIIVALIAPAMPGYSTFIDYDIRNTEYYDLTKDNYQFIISLNEFDPALNKYNILGEGGIKGGFGSTSLGCLKEEQENVKKLFFDKFKTLNNPKFVDFSYTSNNYKQNVHNLSAYIQNPKFEIVIDELYK